MGKLVKNIFLFLLPICIILLILPIDKREKYTNLKDDCFNHGVWLHDRIFENKRPIDIAFIGSSHTINAIDDKLIEEALSIKKLKVCNLGYCRLGRNLSWAVAKELLTIKKPKYLVLEVMENEDRFSHPIFPFVANQCDVYFSYPIINPDYFEDSYLAFSYKVQLLQEDFLGQKVETAFDLNNYGQAVHNDTASNKMLANFWKERHRKREDSNKLEYEYRMIYPRIWIKKLAQLCHEHNIKLYFLYLPSYGSQAKIPAEIKTYLTYGKVLIPPDSIFENVNNWYDDNHFNKNGSRELSTWFYKQVSNELIAKYQEQK